jgi:hypothetical protein
MEIETDMETEIDMEMETETDNTWTHGIGEHLLSNSYGAIVLIVPYGMPLK